ncbi:hypothetical protein ABKN59_002847 [Abortiporus biennis]
MASSSSSSSSKSQQYPGSSYYWINRVPAIFISIPRKGTQSPKVDERCFTYCTQSVRGRFDGAEPWCRSFCIRRVFNHEVRRILNTPSYLPMHDKHNISPESSNTEGSVEIDAKYPLPPEGQRTPQFLETLSGKKKDGDAEGSTWKSIAGEKHPDEMKYWREGWYLWMSESRWAAQEKMDLMMCDLEKQAEWQKYKERTNQEWEAHEKGLRINADMPTGHIAMDEQSSTSPSGVPEATSTQEHTSDPRQTDHGDLHPLPQAPFADSTSHSLLLPIPPELPPINEYIRKLLAPTRTLLDLTEDSVRTGAQRQFAYRVWEKAQTNEPFILARNVCRKIYQTWKNVDDEDQEGQKGKDA